LYHFIKAWFLMGSQRSYFQIQSILLGFSIVIIPRGWVFLHPSLLRKMRRSMRFLQGKTSLMIRRNSLTYADFYSSTFFSCTSKDTLKRVWHSLFHYLGLIVDVLRTLLSNLYYRSPQMLCQIKIPFFSHLSNSCYSRR